MSEQRVSDLLEEVARPVPPPDLAEQAWRRAGQIRRRRLAVVGATTAVAAVVAGIAFLLPASPADVTPTAQELRGRLFTSMNATDADRSPVDQMQTGSASLEFTSDGRYVARTGCFIMSGRVRAERGRLDLSGRESRFSPACDNLMVAYNPLFTKLFETDPSYRLEGNTLTLTSGDTEIVLRGLPGRMGAGRTGAGADRRR